MIGPITSSAKVGLRRTLSETAHIPSLPIPALAATSVTRLRGRLLGISLFLSTTLTLFLPLAHGQTRTVNGQVARSLALDPAVCIEIPNPEALLDRVLDPRTQKYLNVLPQYRRFRQGDQFRQVQLFANMIAIQLGTTWEKGLRGLTGGGIIAAVESDASHEPRISLLITPKDPALLKKTQQVLLRMTRQDAKSKGTPDPVQTIRHHGLDLYAVSGEQGPAYTIIAGTLVISNSTKNLKLLIDEHDNRAKPALTRLADHPDWKAQRERQGPDLVAWGHVNLEKLKQIDAKKFTLPAKVDTGIILFFGSWYETLRRAPAVKAAIRWSSSELGATVELPIPREGRPEMLKGYVPEAGHGNGPLLRPPGTIASMSLWRDWATLWESRSDLFPPETVQGFAQLDTLAGQFFGGREFGPDVLAAFAPHWRLVVADQDFQAIKPEPDPKIPAFALVMELNAPDDTFASRMKIAFQSIVAISNVDGGQKRNAVLELGSEEVEGITIATTRFLVPPSSAPANEQVQQRYNFSPAAAQVGKYFVLSSTKGLARALVKELKTAGSSSAFQSEAKSTLMIEATGPEAARFLEKNHSRMVMQAVLKQGDTKEKAEQGVALNIAFFEYLRHAQLVVRDAPEATQFQLKFELAP